MIGAKVAGADETSRALGLLVKQAEASIKSEIRRATISLASKARSKVPVASKDLKSSIQTSFENRGLVGKVAVTARYAAFVEGILNNFRYGRKPGKWPPVEPISRWVKIKRLDTVIGSLASAVFLVRRKIGRKGTPAQPFFTPARDSEEPVFRNNIEKVVSRSASQIAFLKHRAK